MPVLTDSDYDALFAAMKDDLPRMWREVFPKVLAQRRNRRAHHHRD
jgi:hypothetical protein